MLYIVQQCTCHKTGSSSISCTCHKTGSSSVSCMCHKTGSSSVFCTPTNFIVEYKFVKLFVVVRTVVMTPGFVPNCFSETTVSFGVEVLRNTNGLLTLVSCPLTSECVYVTLLLSRYSRSNNFTVIILA